MRGRRVTTLLTVLASAAALLPTAGAQAVTVTHCYSNSWPAATNCPSQPSGARHTYKGGQAASSGTPYYLAHAWYVAYTSSNASTVKYIDNGPAGTILYSSFPNNSELLRGYASHNIGGALFGDGWY